MNTETLPRRVSADLAGVVAGLATALLVAGLVGRWLFFPLGQGPLVIGVGYPGAILLGIGVGLVARGIVRGSRTPYSPGGVALALGAVALVAVGGAFGVYADIANSPFREFLLSVGFGLAAGVAVAVATYRHLDRDERGERRTAVRSLAATVAGIVAGLVGTLALFVGLTELLAPHIWPAPIVTGPVAIVAGLVLAVVVYRYVAGRGKGA